MICYECQQADKRRDAVALCHHCSAALCQEHALAFADPVTAQYPLMQDRCTPPSSAGVPMQHMQGCPPANYRKLP